MSEAFTLVIDEADPEDAPRGNAQQLADAVAILLDSERSSEDWEEAAEAVISLAAAFNHDSRASSTAVRVAGVTAELAAIETAAARLSAALARASPATLDALNGRGIGGAPLSLPIGAEALRLDALAEIAGRYVLPDDPYAAGPALARTLAARLERKTPTRRVMPIEWPVGAAALGELARIRRRDFENLFRPERGRIADARDFGPDGALSPVPGRRRRSVRRRSNDPRSEPDRGGQENAVTLMRGKPGWTLARDSYLCLRRWRPDQHLTATRGRPLHAFLLAVYAYATGVSAEERKGDAGLEHHARAAVKIMAALERSEGDGPLTDDDFARRASLSIARFDGIVPIWLK